MGNTLTEIETEITTLLGDHPDVPAATVRTLLQDANRTILAAERHWEQEPAEVIRTISAETTGTDAGVTNGSTTVTTADAVSAWAGSMFRRGTDSFFFEVSSVSAGVSIELELAWPAATASAQSFTIFQRYQILPADAREVYEVWSERQMEQRTLKWLNDRDPNRQDTSDVPEVWVYATRGATLGLPRIEIWPRPTTATTLRLVYSRTGELDADADIPIYPAHLLTALGTSNCMQRLFATTNEAQWARMATEKYAQYRDQLATAIQENRGRIQAKTKVKKIEGIVASDYALNHDVYRW